jgi:hypothetical protein
VYDRYLHNSSQLPSRGLFTTSGSFFDSGATSPMLRKMSYTPTSSNAWDNSYDDLYDRTNASLR